MSRHDYKPAKVDLRAPLEQRIELLFAIGSPSAEVTAEELLEDLAALEHEDGRRPWPA